MKKLTVEKVSVEISSICFDSRLAEPNSLFVAVKGAQSDGHNFINDSIVRGATFIVHEDENIDKDSRATYIRVKDSRLTLAQIAQDFYDNPSTKLKLVGVTGTNGKTTTATLLFKLFEGLGHKSTLLSTIENKISEETFPATLTTPDPIALASFLDQAVKRGCQYAFMECSSHAIDQKRITGLEFAGAVFTNLTHDHLDYHKTIEAYAEAKKSLFDFLPANSFALANADDKMGRYMLKDTRAHKYFFSLESDADFNEIIETKLVGKFNAYNALGIYATAVLLGAPADKVKQALKELEAPAGRMELIESRTGIRGIVDYAHTPDALENVLRTSKEIIRKGGKIITVVGCGGDRDRTKRPIMAKIACELSDVSILTSDNPRTEDPEKILDDMVVGVPVGKKFEREPDRTRAIARAVELAKPGDIILVAGKGHEDYQILKGGKIHFSDQEEVKKIFNKIC